MPYTVYFSRSRNFSKLPTGFRRHQYQIYVGNSGDIKGGGQTEIGGGGGGGGGDGTGANKATYETDSKGPPVYINVINYPKPKEDNSTTSRIFNFLLKPFKYLGSLLGFRQRYPLAERRSFEKQHGTGAYVPNLRSLLPTHGIVGQVPGSSDKGYTSADYSSRRSYPYGNQPYNSPYTPGQTYSANRMYPYYPSRKAYGAAKTPYKPKSSIDLGGQTQYGDVENAKQLQKVFNSTGDIQAQHQYQYGNVTDSVQEQNFHNNRGKLHAGPQTQLGAKNSGQFQYFQDNNGDIDGASQYKSRRGLDNIMPMSKRSHIRPSQKYLIEYGKKSDLSSNPNSNPLQYGYNTPNNYPSYNQNSRRAYESGKQYYPEQWNSNPQSISGKNLFYYQELYCFSSFINFFSRRKLV